MATNKWMSASIGLTCARTAGEGLFFVAIQEEVLEYPARVVNGDRSYYLNYGNESLYEPPVRIGWGTDGLAVPLDGNTHVV
jgi:hypothetical protein